MSLGGASRRSPTVTGWLKGMVISVTSHKEEKSKKPPEPWTWSSELGTGRSGVRSHNAEPPAGFIPDSCSDPWPPYRVSHCAIAVIKRSTRVADFNPNVTCMYHVFTYRSESSQSRDADWSSKYSNVSAYPSRRPVPPRELGRSRSRAAKFKRSTPRLVSSSGKRDTRRWRDQRTRSGRRAKLA